MSISNNGHPCFPWIFGQSSANLLLSVAQIIAKTGEILAHKSDQIERSRLTLNFNLHTSSVLFSPDNHLSLPKMKYIFSQEQLVIPENVKIHIRSRIVTVEGPRGNLPLSLNHPPPTATVF